MTTRQSVTRHARVLRQVVPVTGLGEALHAILTEIERRVARLEWYAVCLRAARGFRGNGRGGVAGIDAEARLLDRRAGDGDGLVVRALLATVRPQRR
jgi:hypothetical protein